MLGSAVKNLDDFCIVSGPSSRSIAKRMAEELRAKLIEAEWKRFPDGENYIRIKEQIMSRYAIVVQSTPPPQDTSLMQLILINDLLRDIGCKTVAVVPYLAYARQHRRYLEGEAISIKTIARMIEASGAMRLLTVDIHNIEGLGYFTIPANSISAIPALADYVCKNIDTSNLVAVAPDMGAKTRVETFAMKVGCDFIVMEKQRDRLTGEVTSTLDETYSLKGKDIIIVDDLISTGGSIVEASKKLKLAGARNIFVACTHAILANNAVQKIKESGVKDIIATDTIEGEYSKVTVSLMLSDFVKRL